MRYNISFHPDMVIPLSNVKVWQRMVGNLIHSYSMRASEDEVDRFFFSLFVDVQPTVVPPNQTTGAWHGTIGGRGAMCCGRR